MIGMQFNPDENLRCSSKVLELSSFNLKVRVIVQLLLEELLSLLASICALVRASSFPEIQHEDGSIGGRGANLIAAAVPADLKDTAGALVRVNLKDKEKFNSLISSYFNSLTIN